MVPRFHAHVVAHLAVVAVNCSHFMHSWRHPNCFCKHHAVPAVIVLFDRRAATEVISVVGEALVQDATTLPCRRRRFWTLALSPFFISSKKVATASGEGRRCIAAASAMASQTAKRRAPQHVPGQYFKARRKRGSTTVRFELQTKEREQSLVCTEPRQHNQGSPTRQPSLVASRVEILLVNSSAKKIKKSFLTHLRVAAAAMPSLSCPPCARFLAARRRRSHRLAATASSPDAGGLPFTVLKANDKYELRLYTAYTVASAAYTTRPEGLDTLSGYFEAHSLPPTQPLLLRYEPQADGQLAKRMELRVVVPGACAAAAQAQQPPQPAAGSGVELRVAGGELVAATGVSGNVTPEVARQVRAALVAALEADGLRLCPADAGGAFRLCQFGPLFSLKERKNELLLGVVL